MGVRRRMMSGEALIRSNRWPGREGDWAAGRRGDGATVEVEGTESGTGGGTMGGTEGGTVGGA